MKAVTLMTAQMHRNAELVGTPLYPYEPRRQARPLRRRGRRRL